MRLLATFLFITISHCSFGQFFNRFDSVPVSEENGALQFPWAGGLNHPQFSNIDFDMDGTNDLLVFDKSGNKLICLRMNESNEYEIAPQYREMFICDDNTGNERLHDWVLLRDFNDDGKADVFSYSNGGFAVYRNDGTADTLIFTLMSPKLESDYGNGPINIYVSPTDLPAIMDVDGDKDMDIVTFSLFGTAAEYHQNQSMELYGTPDSLVMVRATPCWGNFEEDPSSVAVDLDVTCKGGGYLPTQEDLEAVSSGSGPHSGFTMLGLDIEGDGDQDLVVSNVSFNTMNLLTNDGNPTTAHMGEQDLTFPANFSNTDAIDIYTFPVAFLADVNNDGKEDLVASAYQENNGNNYQSGYLYTNSASSGYDFTFQKNNFLQDDMIDLGTSAYPVLFDYDQDGLKDLLIGNRGYFQSTSNYSAQLAYYRNTGTATTPSFELQTRDLLNLSSMNLDNVAVTFGDIDGDGDDDMLLGNAAGQIHYFENSAGAGNECSFALTELIYQGIDISGQFATPCLYNVNDDDLLDLVIGEKNGNLNFYENTGTETDPVFTLTNTNWGEVNMRRNGLSDGYSAPFLYEYGNELQMIVGSESGDIDVYDGIAQVVNGPEELVGQIGEGTEFTTGTETTPFVFELEKKTARHQYLIRAEELVDAGFYQGVIEKIALTTENGPSANHAKLYIRFGNTELNELNGFVEGLTTMYFTDQGTIPQGVVEFVGNHSPAFQWDGESNLIIEFCWYHANTSPFSNTNVEYTDMGYNCTAFATQGGINPDPCTLAYQGSTQQRPNFNFTIRPSFNLKSQFPVYEGERTAVTLTDITNDGLPELLVGNLAGGLAFYKGDTVGININNIEEAEQVHRSELNLYPNPNNGTFTLEPHSAMEGNVALRVFNTLGEVVWQGQTSNLIRETIDLSELKNGIYLLDARSENKVAVKRFIVQR